MMNDIISLKTNRLQIKTLSTIQKVKYDLKASNQTPVQKYRRINFLRSPVDQKLCSKITSSWKAYEDRLKETQQKKKRYNEEMGVSTITKKKRVSPDEEAPKRKFLKNNALRHPYQRITE